MAKKRTLLQYDINDAFNIVSGKTHLILDSYNNIKALSLRQFARDRNSWTIAAKSHYALQVGMIRKEHHKSDMIRKKINECFEVGIIDKWTKLNIEMLGFIILSRIKNSADEEMLTKLGEILNRHKETISLEDLKGTFKLLSYGFIISFDVFMIEIMRFIILFIFDRVFD
jgi:hypothetical protein